MATKKKLLQAAAGSAGGAEALNVENVFSTHLYTGTDAAQTITNGIDLAGEGGLVWMKNRTSATYPDHALFDSETVTGSTFPVVQKAWVSNSAGTLDGYAPGFTFTSTGFTTAGRTDTDESGVDYATWSFRKCPKFFDVVNYTGDGTSGRTISHNLGVVPAMIIVLGAGTGDYWVYHKDVGNTKYLELNKTTAAQTNSSAWNNTTPTDSVFTVGNGVPVNYNNYQYTAYLFADNDGDGDFGPTGDQDIIKCGSYTGDGGAGTTEVNLGFEPQWILVKASSAADNWFVIDNMRGWATHNNTANDAYLSPNATNAESTGGFLDITSTGFKTTLYSNVNVSGRDYIYIAIRRGPMAAPESATDVFDVDALNNPATTPGWQSGFPVDMYLSRRTDNTVGHFVFDRLRGDKYLQTSDADSEATDTAYMDYMDGVGPAGNITTFYSWMWRRAPGFFDVVAYTGDGTASHTINHNLGVVPEMIWTKNRSSATALDWSVYHSGIGRKLLILNNTDAETSYNFFTYDPTSSTWIVRNHPTTNTSGDDYIMYLFASLDGVSKVGSYTGNYGTATTVDCGFSAGSRMVIIKSTSSGGWYIMDTERGIGYDLQLNSTDQQYGANNYISNHSTGFTVNSTSPLNISGTYIFYAIA